MNKLVKIVAAIVVVAWGTPAIAQIPDAGFETWSGGAPAGWRTDNVPGSDTLIWQTTDAHSGSSAAEGVAVGIPGTQVVIAPDLSLVMPWTSKPTSFVGYYKYSPVGGDTLLLAAVFARNSSAIGAGELKIVAGASSYTQFSIPINYFGTGSPDSTAIVVTIIPTSGSSYTHAGSTFKVDDFSFAGVTGVSKSDGTTPLMYALGQNYPNPFNPTTVIRYQLPASSQVSLKVYDVLGREVASLVDAEKNAGIHSVTFDGSNLSSGVYFYRLQAGNFSAMKKLMLVK